MTTQPPAPMVSVPREPTHEMIEALVRRSYRYTGARQDLAYDLRAAWPDMLSAAPSALAPADVEVAREIVDQHILGFPGDGLIPAIAAALAQSRAAAAPAPADADTAEAVRETVQRVLAGEFIDDDDVVELAETFAEQSREIAELRAERVQLRRRLEIDRIWVKGDGGELVEQSADLPESLDGISCRDETIKLQDKRIAAAESRLAAVVEAGNALLKSAADCSPSAPDAPPSAWHKFGAALAALGDGT